LLSSKNFGKKMYQKRYTFKFYILNSNLCFAIIHLILITSLKWIRSLSIYLIACMNGWIVLCSDVPKAKYDIWTIEVLNLKILKDDEILSELDLKYQILLNLIIELSASHWIMTPNDILNLINWIDGIKWMDCVLSWCP
jgi:hypothetical protein